MARWKEKAGVKSGTKKVLSGFCGIGCHEGTRPRNRRQQPLMTCTLIDTCDCSCHDDIDEMFKLANRPRIPVENPEHIPDRGDYVMPTYEEVMANRVVESKKPPIENRKPLEVVAVHSFEATPSGKRARGQLEDQVLVVCSQFSRGMLDAEILTPSIIATQIDEVEPPSVGAIGAVFDRWVRIGFANCPKKPVRFESFTPDGMALGLDRMKDQFKSQQKRQVKGEATRRMGVSR